MTWIGARTATAAALFGAVTGLPFLTAGGESALRFDAAGMRLLVLGSVLWIEDFPLLLLAILALVVLAAAAATALGRAWCGWGCPQTALPLLADRVAGLLPRPLRLPARHLLLLLLAGSTALALAGYFVPPGEALRTAASRPLLLGSLLVLFGSAYAVPALAGPAFCRAVCPYAMIQNILVDGDTLLVAFDATRAGDCLESASCVRACPVGIDIREGFRRECLACATCADACAAVTVPAGIEPLLAYRGRWRRPKVLFPAGVAAALLLLLAGLAAARPPAGLVLRRIPEGAAGTNRYEFRVRNNTLRPLPFSVAVDGAGSPRAWGDASFTLPPGKRMSGRLLVRATPPGGDRVRFRFASPAVTLHADARYLP